MKIIAKPTRNGIEKNVTFENGFFVRIEFNDKCRVSKIYAQNTADEYNLESIFTQSKRKLKDAAKIIEEGKIDSIHKIRELFRSLGIKSHQYCAMD